jgi:hypothetical protein
MIQFSDVANYRHPIHASQVLCVSTRDEALQSELAIIHSFKFLAIKKTHENTQKQSTFDLAPLVHAARVVLELSLSNVSRTSLQNLGRK